MLRTTEWEDVARTPVILRRQWDRGFFPLCPCTVGVVPECPHVRLWWTGSREAWSKKLFKWKSYLVYAMPCARDPRTLSIWRNKSSQLVTITQIYWIDEQAESCWNINNGFSNLRFVKKLLKEDARLILHVGELSPWTNQRTHHCRELVSIVWILFPWGDETFWILGL